LVAPAEVSPGLTAVPLEGAEPAVDELGVDGLPLAVDAGADAVVLGLAVLVGVAVALVQGVPVALAFVALILDVAEAVALLVALPVALPVAVTVLVAGELSPGLALPLAGLPLELALSGLVVAVAGAVGVTGFRAWFDGDGEALDGQTVTVVPTRAAEVPA
jgi:hypothetical protein